MRTLRGTIELVLIFTVTIIPRCVMGQWNWQSPVPQGNTLLDVQFVDTSLGWAVGEYGTVLHTTSSGASWYEQEYGRTDNILSISMVSATEGWAVGDNGIILHTTDGGDNWNEQTSGVTSGLNAVKFLDTLSGWAAGDNETIFHTSDGGTTWTIQHQTLMNSSSINSLWFLNSSEGWAAGSKGRIFHTTDAGANWLPQSLSSGGIAFLSITFVDPTLGIAIGTGGTVYRTDNGGTTWSPVATGETVNLNQVAMQNSLVGWIVGDAGRVLRTINGGLSWSASTIGDGNNLNGLSRMGSTLWSVGEFGLIMRSTNSGVSWTQLDNGSRLSVNWIDFPSNTTGYAVGQTGLISHTTDGGTTWTQLSSPAPSVSCYGVKCTDNTHAWAVGDNGTILRTTDGTNWSTQSSPTTTHALFGVAFSDLSNGWIVGGEFTGFTGVILHSSDGGNSWNVQNSSVPSVLYGISFPTASVGWVVGDNGTILRTTNAGSSWATQTSGAGTAIYWCSFIDQNYGWAVGDSGRILHTTNGGTNWSLQNSGTSVSLYSVVSASPTEAIISGDQGTILHTTDGGAHWSQEYSRTLYGLFGIARTPSSRIFACGDYGTILAYVPPITGGTVTGLVFNDLNGNGIRDEGEPGLPGWQVTFSGSQNQSTRALADGTFSCSLPFGSYTMTLNVPELWSQTYPPVPPGSYSFTLSADTAMFSGDFGAYSTSAHGYSLLHGWNLMSLPLVVPDPRVSTLYPSANSQAYSFLGRYVELDSLHHGAGFWLKFSDDQTAWIAGSPVDRDTIRVLRGWNIIGSVSQPVLVGSIGENPTGLIRSTIWSYNGTSYQSVDTLLPSKGYWVKVRSDGQLVLNATSTGTPMSNLFHGRVLDTDLPPPPPDETANIEVRTSDIPREFVLSQNYPNPFNPTTDVRYAICDVSYVTLRVYDVLGREVAALVNEVKQPGEYVVKWNASNQPSGVYFYRLEATPLNGAGRGFSQTKKLVLSR